MKKGLTNRNYLLQLDNERFVLRTPHFHSEHIVNRHHETLALEAIKHCDIDVETIYYDEASGYKVTRYIPDALDFAQYQKEDKIIRCAKLMKRFHQLHKKTQVRFAPIQRYSTYKEHVQNPLYDVTPYTYLLQEVEELKGEEILCHNDWVEGNILFTANKTHLIDFEYAADNDPLFDVMSFLTENNITDELQRKQFYDIYFDAFTPQVQQRLSIWECFHNLLWCMWAMMMWEQRHEDVYKKIAHEKYVALQKSVQKRKP